MSTPHIIADRFELGALIDRGGMSNVYRGYDRVTVEPVAIKALKSELIAVHSDIVARFLREAETLRRLEHPNIVKVLTTISEGDQHYIIMEYISGGSLADLLRVQSQLPVRRVLEIAQDLADALSHVHQASIIHRDIKPENVLLADDGTPRLTDFGVARLEDDLNLTQAGAFVGTWAYLSPEACRGKPLDLRTDIWAFGIMLYEMLAGCRPFDASHAPAIINEILSSPTPPLRQKRPDVPQSLVDLIERMLEKDLSQRIRSARQISTHIETLLQSITEGTSVDSAPAVAPAPAAEPSASVTSGLERPAHPPTSPPSSLGRTVIVTDSIGEEDERVHLDRLHENYQKRLWFLEEQAANFGLEVAPHIPIEIEKLQKKLAEVRDRLKALGVSMSEIAGNQSTPMPAGASISLESSTDIIPPASVIQTPAAQLPDGAVTFLFTDVEDSTMLWEQHGSAMQQAIEQHDSILRGAVRAHGGYQFATLVDAFHFAFAHATAALTAALDAQRGLQAATWNVTGPLHVRMALHTGDVQLRDDNYSGPVLNRTDRLLDAGHGGQTLLSLATAELVREHLPPDTKLRDLGRYQLKDLTRPEQIFQLVAPDLPSVFPPLRTLNLRRTNLQPQPNPLIGRELDVDLTLQYLRQPNVRLLTLIGPGGIGKTRLAYQVAAELVDEFADGAYVVELATINAVEQVATQIAQELGVTVSGNQAPIADVIDYLRERHLLLVLDNFEQIIAAAPLVDDLLQACPRLKILVTSREHLRRARFEQILSVPPIALPDPQHASSATPIAEYAAVELFVERAKAALRDFTLTHENAAAVADICILLDGLPLAIELAAARIKSMSAQEILTGLKDTTGKIALDLLEEYGSGPPDRQHSLSAAIAWSYDLLNEREQRLFRRLTVFLGGRTYDSIAAVCDIDGDLDRVLLRATIESLIDKSLMRKVERHNKSRFVMLKTIHTYGRERLEASGELEILQRQHADYFLDLAERAEPELTGKQQAELLDQLDQESGNLRLALLWAQQQDAVETFARLSAALWWFWYTRGYLHEGRERLDEALKFLDRKASSASLELAASQQPDAARPPSDAVRGLRAKVLTGVGGLAWALGEYPHAKAYYEEALALHRSLGNTAGEAQTLDGLGLVAFQEEAYDRAETFNTESLHLFRTLGNLRGQANALSNLGMIAQLRGDYPQAHASYSQSLALRRDLDDRRGIAIALTNLGEVALHQREFSQARTCYCESLGLCRELGDKEGVAYCLHGLAVVAGAEDQAARAAQLWGAEEQLRETIKVHRPPADRATYQKLIAENRSAVDPATWTAAWQAGRSMSPAAAIRFALGESDDANADDGWSSGSGDAA